MQRRSGSDGVEVDASSRGKVEEAFFTLTHCEAHLQQLGQMPRAEFTVVRTLAIETLIPKLWEDWLRAQPFRMDKDNPDGSWMQWLQKPSAHKSEAQMMSKLDEAVEDAKIGG